MQYFKKAKWIWCKNAADINAYVVFDQTFEMSSSDAHAVLRISADSNYCVSLNGKVVGFGQYADYPEYKVFDEYEVTSFLSPGINAIRVIGYCPGIDTSVYRRGEAGVLYEISAGETVVVSSQPGTPCAPHAHYQSGDIEKISGQLGFAFAYDETKVSPERTPAILVQGANSLYPRPVKRLDVHPQARGILKACGIWYDYASGTPGWRMQHNPMAYRSVNNLCGLDSYPAFPSGDGVLFLTDEGDGIYMLIDLQKETSGLLDIDFETDTGAEILIGWGEHTDDLRLRTSIGTRNFATRYVARPGRRHFTHTLGRIGLRYIEVFVRAHSVRLYYAGILPTLYPLNRLPHFHTSDRLHTRIYDACLNTLINCVHEHYEDCPWREQTLYAMDSRNQMLCGYYASV